MLGGLQSGRSLSFYIRTNVLIRSLLQAFPVLYFASYSSYVLITEGDFVASRWIGGDTHTGGPFHDLVVGNLSLENSGNEMTSSEITIFTL
jgi:hypothetical protein